jgi:hypothetical protein
VFLLCSGWIELGRKPPHLADSLGHRGRGRTGVLAELLRQEADDSRRDCGGNELGALVASARDEHIHRLPPDHRQRLVQDTALLMIEHRIAIAMQDQVRRRASVHAVTRAGRSRKLGVVVDPVEPEQRRAPRRREDLSLERVAPPGKEKVAAEAVGDDRAHCTRDTEVVADIALELHVTGCQRRQ